MRKTDDEFLKDIYKKEKEYRDKQRKRKKTDYYNYTFLRCLRCGSICNIYTRP